MRKKRKKPREKKEPDKKIVCAGCKGELSEWTQKFVKNGDGLAWCINCTTWPNYSK